MVSLGKVPQDKTSEDRGPIVLTGFSGSGKSTIVEGLELGKEVRVVDTDKLLVSKFGKPIKDIFRVEGEKDFRAEEKAVLKEAIDSADIIATGGGCLLDKDSLSLVKNEAVLVYIQVEKERLLNRLKEQVDEERPLLKDNDFEKLFSKREPAYLQADITLSNNYSNIEQLTQAVSLISKFDSKLLKKEKLFLAPAVYTDGSEAQHIVGRGVVSELEEIVKLYFPKSKKIAILADSNLEYLREDILSKFDDSIWVPIPSGENSKSFSNYEQLVSRLAEEKLLRDDLVIAIGGGVVGDLAGFAASSYLRGVNLLQIPTTVVAQVDSAIGGKTGINLPTGKNLVGTFYPAKVVLSDTELLSTLPEREYISGLAEVVKYAAVYSESFFDWIEENYSSLLNREAEALYKIIEVSTQTKIKVVFDDLLDLKGIRAKLNFGHTFGHAIEKLTGYGQLLHGEAVAIGMKIAVGFSENEKVCQSGSLERLTSLLDKLKLNLDVQKELVQGRDSYIKLRKEGLSLEKLSISESSSKEQEQAREFLSRWLKTLRVDKKSVSSNEISFICLEKIGSGVVRQVQIEELLDYFADKYR